MVNNIGSKSLYVDFSEIKERKSIKIEEEGTITKVKLASTKACYERFHIFPTQKLERPTDEKVHVIGMSLQNELWVQDQDGEEFALENIKDQKDLLRQGYRWTVIHPEKTFYVNMKEGCQVNNKKRPLEAEVDHESVLLKRMRVLLEDKPSHDIFFEIEGEQFGAHRFWVAKASPFFSALLEGPFKKETVIHLKDLSCEPEYFKRLIEFMYVGKINLDKDNIIPLTYLANYFKMEDLEHHCFETFEFFLNPDTFMSYFLAVGPSHPFCDRINEYFFKNCRSFLASDEAESINEFSEEKILSIMETKSLLLNDRLKFGLSWITYSLESLDQEKCAQLFKQILAHTNQDNKHLCYCMNVLRQLANKKPCLLDRMQANFTFCQEDFNFYCVYIDLLLSLNKKEKADQLSQQLIDRFPTNFLVLIGRAHSLTHLGRFEEAKIIINKALNLQPDNSFALGRKGDILLSNDELEQAKLTLEKAIALDSKNVFAASRYATTLFQLKEMDAAEARFKHLLELEPFTIEYEKAYILSHYAVLAEKKDDDLDLAEKHLIEALELEAENIFALIQYAGILLRRDKDVEAELSFQKILQLDPKNISALEAYTDLFIDRCQLDEAEKKVLELLENDQKSLFALSRQGEILRQTHQLEEAEIQFKQILSLNPDHIYSLSKYADILLQLNQYDEAEIIIQRSKTLNLDHDFTSSREAELLRLKGLFLEAEVILRNLRPLDQQLYHLDQEIDSFILGRHADVLIHLHEINGASDFDLYLADAKTQLKKALKINSKNAFALSRQAELFRLTAEYPSFISETLLEQAKDTFQQAIILGCKDLFTFRGYANVLMLTGNLKEAQNYFQQALLLNPLDSFSLSREGEFLRRSHKPQEAMIKFEEVLAREPNHIYALGRYADLFIQQNQINKADKIIQQAKILAPTDSFILSREAEILRLNSQLLEAEVILQKLFPLVRPFYHVDLELDLFILERHVDVLIQLNQIQAATIQLKKLVAKTSNPASALSRQAQLSIYSSNLPDFEKAEADFVQSVNLGCQDKGAFRGYANALKLKGKLIEAENYFQKAIQLDPLDRFSLGQCASVLQKIGKIYEAENYFEKAYSLNPGDFFISFKYAFILHEVAKFELSEKIFQTIFKNGLPQFNGMTNTYQPIHSEIPTESLLFVYAKVLKEVGKLEEAEKILGEMTKSIHRKILIEKTKANLNVPLNIFVEYMELLNFCGKVNVATLLYSQVDKNDIFRSPYEYNKLLNLLQQIGDVEALERFCNYTFTYLPNEKYTRNSLFSALNAQGKNQEDKVFELHSLRLKRTNVSNIPSTIENKPITQTRTAQLTYINTEIKLYGWDEQITILINDKQYAIAEERVKEKLTKFPNNAFVLATYAFLLEKSDRFPEAKIKYEECLKIAPKFFDVSLRYANLLVELGLLKEARTQCKTLLKAYPKYTNAIILYTKILKALNKPEQAHVILEEALKNNPQNILLLNYSAETLKQMGKLEEANAKLEAVNFKLEEVKVKYEEWIVNNPLNNQLLKNYTSLFFQMNKLEEGENRFKELLVKHPTNQMILITYIRFLKERGKLKEAENELKNFLASDPKNSDRLHSYVLGMLIIDRQDEAKSKCEEILASDPQNATFLKLLKITLEGMNKKKVNENGNQKNFNQ